MPATHDLQSEPSLHPIIYGHYINGASTPSESAARFESRNRALSYPSPFGGHKRSGLGREGGLESIKKYVQTKSIWICTEPDRGYAFAMK